MSQVILAQGEAGPADIIRGTGCTVFDANGNEWDDPNAELQIVFTNNPNGVANASCRGNLPAGAVLPKKTLHYDFNNTGLYCFTADDTWKMTVTPSGSFSITCHFK